MFGKPIGIAMILLGLVQCRGGGDSPAVEEPGAKAVGQASAGGVAEREVSALFDESRGGAPREIQLPPPDTDGGRPLMQALKKRRSERSFSERPLPPRVVSELLWATAGVNRPDRGLRTAPTARNWQEIDLYVATVSGLWRYEPERHALSFVHGRDIRAETGLQDFVGAVPLTLIFVADKGKMGDNTELRKSFYAGADSAFMAQNAYLYCASEGLATVVRAYLDPDELAAAMNVKPPREVTLAQSIGYPAK